MAGEIAQTQTPGRRRRSEAKREAILNAAEERFLNDGYERASMDLIASGAGVSKRTVYDHFGEKNSLFQRVVERVHAAVSDAVSAALAEELGPGIDARDGLRRFARRIVTGSFPSSDYVVFRRLTTERSGPNPPFNEADRPERALSLRLAALADSGVLQTDDPDLAARHFTALTVELALHALDGGASESEILRLVDAGVDVFMRAYG